MVRYFTFGTHHPPRVTRYPPHTIPPPHRLHTPGTSNAIFDESGHFLAYTTLIGIKIINLETNKVSRIIGRIENSERFLNLALFQGIPKVNSVWYE